MKNIKIFLNINISLLTLFLLISYSSNLFAQQKTEIVGFKVRTTSPGGNYSPKNIGAIWIEDSTGKFVKTLERWANNRKQYLYTWNNSTGGNVVDAITSATFSSHKTHDITWNLKDASGNLVPNGIYNLKVEMTDKHAQGPLASFSFPVGDSSNTLVFPDEAYFHDIQLYWNSTATDINDVNETPNSYKLNNNYPNPFNPSTIISYSIPQNSFVSLTVYNGIGELVSTLVSEEQSVGNYFVNFKGNNLSSGIYFYTLKAGNFTKTNKMVLLR